VFARLRKANLKLKASTCHLFQRRVSFLGHTVSEYRVKLDPRKVEAVKTWPRPTNLTKTRAFVGLASYYRSQIRSFADIGRPLHMLKRKGERFVWTPFHEQAFVKLEECLVTVPVLISPREEGMFILDTDASDFALGAILQQKQEKLLPMPGRLRIEPTNLTVLLVRSSWP